MLSTLIALVMVATMGPATTVPEDPYETTVLPSEPIEESIPYMGTGDEYYAEIITQNVCVEWTTTALRAGWPIQDVPRLLRIMERESKCQPDACGVTDSPHIRKCRDWGLMQINDYSWKRTIRGLGLTMDQMHDPYWNLWFARWLFDYSLERNGDGWQPWKKPK